MGIKDMFKGKFNNEDNFNDSYVENDYYGGFENDNNIDQTETEENMSGGGMPLAGGIGHMNQQMGGGISLNGSSIELKVVKPERFDCVSQIAEHLINRKTVVLNLESTNKETARRLIDFLSGVAFSIDGQLKRVANSTYVITPSNVDISSEQLRSKNAQQQQQQQDQRGQEDFYGGNDL